MTFAGPAPERLVVDVLVPTAFGRGEELVECIAELSRLCLSEADGDLVYRLGPNMELHLSSCTSIVFLPRPQSTSNRYLFLGALTQLALVALVLVGCGGAKPAAIDRTPPPDVAKRCGTHIAGAKTFWFRASDGLVLDGVSFGSGDRAVIVIHGYPGTLCDELPFGMELARRGFRVLAYDVRGFGLSTDVRGNSTVMNRFGDDVQGAAELLRRQGAKKVFVVGFSFGGSIATGSAPTLDPPVDGVVNVSGPATLEFAFPGSVDVNGLARASKMRSPLLVLYATLDPRIIPDETARMVRDAPVRDKNLYIYRGEYHADALLEVAPYRVRVLRTIVHFLRTR
jgi:dienelactone hydrolase